MDELVERLSRGNQPIQFEVRTEGLEEVKERIEDGFVFITFPQTKGGTELGINLETKQTDLSKADFSKGTGSLHLSGICELNYQKIRCIADIDLSSRQGEGVVIPIDADGNAL